MTKKTAVLGTILALMLIFIIIFYAGGALKVQASRVNAAASDHPDEFDVARQALLSNSAPFVFSGDIPDAPDNCSLVDLSATLSNGGMFDAEYMNITVEALPGDIAVYALTGDSEDVPAHGSQNVDLKILTRAEAGALRKVSVQYYVYGVSRTVSFTA